MHREDDFFNIDDLLDNGPRTLRKNIQKMQINSILYRNGYFNSSNTYPISSSNINISGFHNWKQIVDTYIKRSRQGNSEVSSTDSSNIASKRTRKEEVRILPLKYISISQYPSDENVAGIHLDIRNLFELNKDQYRAYRIVTNHFDCRHPDPLLMYLGGMAGTGKSRVIKAITYFFEKLESSIEIALLAPTGSAAALIGGSTYHSFLGMALFLFTSPLTRLKVSQTLIECPIKNYLNFDTHFSTFTI